MTWVRIDDRFDEHPKVMAAGPLGGFLFIRGLCYCARNLTDGFIPDAIVRRLTADLEPHQSTMADLMVQAGLWERRDGGFVVHDYLDYNPSREAVLAERSALTAARSAAGRAGGFASGQSRRSKQGSKTEANSEANAKQNGSPVPDPVPVTTTTKATTGRAPERDDDRDHNPPEAAAVAVAPAGGDSSAFCDACGGIFRTLNDLTARTYGLSGPGRSWCHERHREHGVDTVLAVVRDRVKAWGADPQWHANLAPSTLFKANVFDRWRNALGGPVKGDGSRQTVADLKRLIARGKS